MRKAKTIKMVKNSKRDKRLMAQEAFTRDLDSSTSKMALIQMLIPLGLERVEEELQNEVTRLVGKRYQRGGDNKRWASNNGSVFLGDQKLSISVPRVRNVVKNVEIPLKSYEELQSSKGIESLVLSRVINGISQGKYSKAVEQIPAAFGIKKNSVSKKFIKASAKKLEFLMTRDLSKEKIISIFMDGKNFGKNGVIIALGVTLGGKKIPLGFIESGTENHMVCKDFLEQLGERGLCLEKDILFVIDGSKGFRKAIPMVFPNALIQRCQWHKRENILGYLNLSDRPYFKRKLQDAYETPDYDKAKKKLNAVKSELKKENLSALKSLEEGLEETLTLNRLGLFKELGISFKTTNCIESLNSQIQFYTKRVCYWKNSDQRQRWVATSLLEIEPNLRKVKGYRHLAKLRAAMMNENNKKITSKVG